MMRCKTYVEDVEVRCVFNVDTLLADVPEEVVQKINEEPNMAMAIEEIKVSSASFACVKQLVSAVHNCVKIKLEQSSSPAGGAETSAPAPLLKAWSDVATNTASVSGEASKCMDKLYDLLDLKAAGAQMYTQTMEPFKEALYRGVGGKLTVRIPCDTAASK